MVATIEASTGIVVMTKVAVFDPAGTVTEPGTGAEVLELERETVIPPLGALTLRFTVPVTGYPPRVETGLTETDATPGGSIVSGACADAPPLDALILAVVMELTTEVVIVHVAVVDPLGTVN